MSRRALVIGASGQVGRNAAAALLVRGWEVVGTYESRPVAGGEHLDLLREEEVRSVVARVRPRLCVLASALTNVDRCEDEPGLAHALNARAPGLVAEAVRIHGGRTVLLSTEYVFDGSSGPYREDSGACPVCVYGASKLAGEASAREADPECLIIRTTVVFSYHHGDKNFVMQLLTRLGSGERMRVPVDQLSSPTYAPDLGAAIAELAERPGVTGVLNVAGPEVVGRYDFAVTVASRWGFPADLLDPVATSSLGQRARRPLRAGLVVERLQSLGIRTRGIADALSDMKSQARLAPGRSHRVESP